MIELSIVIPTFNEQEFIGRCLHSIYENNYPQEKYEIIIVDGVSNDNTIEKIEKILKIIPEINIKIIINKERITPKSFNLGIENASGKYIMILGAHSHISNNYLSRSVFHIRNDTVDNIGGLNVVQPRSQTTLGKAIAIVMSNPFGIGNASYRSSQTKKPIEVDTVWGGCFKKQMLLEIGGFDERLIRGQDRELNIRIKENGGRVLLDPSIHAYYYARSKLGDFLSHTFKSGRVPFWMSGILNKKLYSWRNMIPFFFNVIIVILFFLSFLCHPFAYLLLSILSIYISLSVYCVCRFSSATPTVSQRLILPILFFLYHVVYGLGSISGLIFSVKRIFTRFINRERKNERTE